jgi:hypothetical protein
MGWLTWHYSINTVLGKKNVVSTLHDVYYLIALTPHTPTPPIGVEGMMDKLY